MSYSWVPPGASRYSKQLNYEIRTKGWKIQAQVERRDPKIVSYSMMVNY